MMCLFVGFGDGNNITEFSNMRHVVEVNAICM